MSKVPPYLRWRWPYWIPVIGRIVWKRRRDRLYSSENWTRNHAFLTDLMNQIKCTDGPAWKLPQPRYMTEITFFPPSPASDADCQTPGESTP